MQLDAPLPGCYLRDVKHDWVFVDRAAEPRAQPDCSPAALARRPLAAG